MAMKVLTGMSGWSKTEQGEMFAMPNMSTTPLLTPRLVSVMKIFLLGEQYERGESGKREEIVPDGRAEDDAVEKRRYTQDDLAMFLGHYINKRETSTDQSVFRI